MLLNTLKGKPEESLAMEMPRKGQIIVCWERHYRLFRLGHIAQNAFWGLLQSNLWLRTQEFWSNSLHQTKYLNLICIYNYSKETRNIEKPLNISVREQGVPAETAEVAIQLQGLLPEFWTWKKPRAGDVLKVTSFVTEQVPEQRGSYTFLSLQGETTTTTSMGYCSVPAVSMPAMEHFQTTTVKHLERLSRRGKKFYKNHTTKIYSRNVFPKLTLHSQNFWEGLQAILGTSASWFCSLALCFNFMLFYVFMGK